MSEFNTMYDYYAMEMSEMESKIDSYDPYVDDDFICSYCEDEDMECSECGITDNDHLIDSYMEASLFGWDS